MRGTYSLATLLLVTAIAAVALAALRGVVVRGENATRPAIEVPLIAGAVAGAVFAVGFTLWRRAALLWTIPATIAGGLLGAAAGAQSTAPVSLTVVVLGPLLVIGGALVVLFNRRRQNRLESLEPHLQPPPAIEPREPDRG